MGRELLKKVSVKIMKGNQSHRQLLRPKCKESPNRGSAGNLFTACRC